MKRVRVYIMVVMSLFALRGETMAQDAAPGYIVTKPDGTKMMAAYILPNGDTMLYCELRPIEITAPKSFANADAYKKFEKYQYYAPTVVNYAVECVKTYRQLEAVTRNGSNRDRKKYIKDLENQMEDKLRDQLKNLTRTQGFLLIEMIERELHMPFYDLVKDVKGSFSAFYWNEFGKLYGYQLKECYVRGQDIILDSVLDRYDLSYFMRPQ